MNQATWRVGWYSKVVLTVIAVSLVGLLVRQLPGKVEAKPGYGTPGVIELTVPKLRRDLRVYLANDDELIKKGELPVVGSKRRALAQKVYDYLPADVEQLLRQVLHYEYAMGYRVKFVSDSLIILEYE
ncbi:hypothetical protein ES702_01639 [subsurface metagenome]